MKGFGEWSKKNLSKYNEVNKNSSSNNKYAVHFCTDFSLTLFPFLSLDSLSLSSPDDLPTDSNCPQSASEISAISEKRRMGKCGKERD